MLPYIDAKTLRDVKMDVKDRLKFDVPIFGEPAPEVSWYAGDDLLEDDKSISITNLEGHTKIVFNEEDLHEAESTGDWNAGGAAHEINK